MFGAPPAINATNQSGLNVTVLDSNTTLFLDSRPKNAGNATNTTNDGSDDPDLAWWAWAMIGGGFLLLIVVLGVTAAFYSDYAKRLMGYNQVPEAADAQPRAGAKVIEVELVHPCRPPHMMTV